MVDDMRGVTETTTSMFCVFLRYPADVRWTPAKIKERRDALGLTQQGLADALGVAKRSVVSWERGEAAPRRLTTLDAVLGDPGVDEEAPQRPDLSGSTPVELVAALLEKVAGLERENAALKSRLRAAELGIEEGPVPADVWADPNLIEGTHPDDNPGDEPRHASS